MERSLCGLAAGQCCAGVLRLAHATDAGTRCLQLTAADAASILSLDPFYAKKSQSAAPLSYRKLYGGNAYGVLSVSSTQTTQLVAGQNASSKILSRVTATESNSLGASTGISKLLDVLGFELGFTSESSNSLAKSTSVSYQSSSATTLQSQTQVTTVFQDSSGLQPPINVLQDLLFQGIAVQDTDMHFPVPPGANPPGDDTPPGDGERGRSWICFPTVPGRPRRCISRNDLPRVPVGEARPHAGPTEYIEHSRYGEWLVQRTATAATLRSVREQRAAAASRHVARRVPAAPPAIIKPGVTGPRR